MFLKRGRPQNNLAVFVATEPDIFKPRHDAFPILNPTTTSASWSVMSLNKTEIITKLEEGLKLADCAF